MGVFFGIYGFLVVFAGAALVLVLIGAIPMSYYNKTLVVEIFSQILTGSSPSLLLFSFLSSLLSLTDRNTPALFTITSLFPLPWRLNDAFQIFLIYSYARRTYERRAKLGLPELSDRNDLPEPQDAEYWIGPGGEKLTGPRIVPSKKIKEKKVKGGNSKKGAKEEVDRAVELDQIESKIGGGSSQDTIPAQDDVVVLTPQEEERLRGAQVNFYIFPFFPSFS